MYTSSVHPPTTPGGKHWPVTSKTRFHLSPPAQIGLTRRLQLRSSSVDEVDAEEMQDEAANDVIRKCSMKRKP